MRVRAKPGDRPSKKCDCAAGELRSARLVPVPARVRRTFSRNDRLGGFKILLPRQRAQSVLVPPSAMGMARRRRRRSRRRSPRFVRVGKRRACSPDRARHGGPPDRTSRPCPDPAANPCVRAGDTPGARRHPGAEAGRARGAYAGGTCAGCFLCPPLTDSAPACRTGAEAGEVGRRCAARKSAGAPPSPQAAGGPAPSGCRQRGYRRHSPRCSAGGTCSRCPKSC